MHHCTCSQSPPNCSNRLEQFLVRIDLGIKRGTAQELGHVGEPVNHISAATRKRQDNQYVPTSHTVSCVSLEKPHTALELLGCMLEERPPGFQGRSDASLRGLHRASLIGIEVKGSVESSALLDHSPERNPGGDRLLMDVSSNGQTTEGRPSKPISRV
jgi:hypothetical protein